MAFDNINITLAYSCGLPAITGLVYYKRMDTTFHPFIWAMWLSLVTETVSKFVLNYNEQPVWIACKSHLYYILNYLFMMMFFLRQKIISFKDFKMLLIIAALIFFLNCLYKPVLASLLGEKTVAFQLIIFFLAVQLLNQQIFNHSIPIIKNPLFFISCGLLFLAFPILQNSIRIIVRLMYNLPSAKIQPLQRIFEIANAISYVLFFYATLCFPLKRVPLNNI